MSPKKETEAKRLEALWAGRFGNEYIERNRAAANGRESFWKEITSKYSFERVLEVGCNVGANLRWLSAFVPSREVYGVDINENSLAELRQKMPQVNALWSPARELPFRNGWFDLTFTAGVLIHQPEAGLADVMREVVRCSRRYVFCLEYFSPRTVEVPYRGQESALFKRDYGGLYQKAFPALKLLQRGELAKAQGWDGVTCWVFEKRR